MKNNIFSEIINIGGVIAKRIKQHISELMKPETPSYKTSASAVPFFAVLAAASGDRHTLFWISVACTLFFTILAISQYGLFSRSKRSTM